MKEPEEWMSLRCVIDADWCNRFHEFEQKWGVKSYEWTTDQWKQVLQYFQTFIQQAMKAIQHLEQKKSALMPIQNEQPDEWQCVCGVCLEIMPIAEWMSYALFWTHYNPGKPIPHEDHPIPHLNRSHVCPHCHAHWELIENLGQTQDWVVDRYHKLIYLVGSPRIVMMDKTDIKDRLWAYIHRFDKHGIRWDRVIEDPEYVFIYGWIENQKHERGDFVLAMADIKKNEVSLLTSSAALSDQVHAEFHDNIACVKFTEYFKDQIQ